MGNHTTVTCSFIMDRDLYNTFKSVISKHGESVKGNLTKYMQSVIKYGIPNAHTLLAIQEVESLEKNKNGKTYTTFDELLEELENEWWTKV